MLVEMFSSNQTISLKYSDERMNQKSLIRYCSDKSVFHVSIYRIIICISHLYRSLLFLCSYCFHFYEKFFFHDVPITTPIPITTATAAATVPPNLTASSITILPPAIANASAITIVIPSTSETRPAIIIDNSEFVITTYS